MARCDRFEPSVLASAGLASDQIGFAKAEAFLSDVNSMSFGPCTVFRGDDVPVAVSQLVGFDGGHAVVSDVIGSNGERLAVFVSAGVDAGGPSADHLAACRAYVSDIETSFDMDTERAFMHATSMALRDREDAWQTSAAKLQAQNSELDRLASYAAHEFKTPLRSIMFDTEYVASKLAGALEEGPSCHIEGDGRTLSIPEPQLLEMSTTIQRIYDQSSQLSSQLDDLLFVVRSDDEDPPTELIDMASLVTTMVERHRYDIASADASVDLGPLPTVESNRQFLSIVFSNLISNAVRFRSPARPLVIGIAAEPYEAGVVFSVRDNGIGIGAEDHDQIFSPFHRLGQSDEGLGLGLSLCAKLLDRLQADLLVTSELDQGACFTVRLPQP